MNIFGFLEYYINRMISLTLLRKAMMETLQISDELYQKLGSLAKPFTDRPEDVIRRLVDNALSDKRNPARISTQSSVMEPKKKYVHSKGGRIPCPLKLRMQYKGTTTYGEAKDYFILFEGRKFTAPSPAAEYVAETKGALNPHRDGWRDLEYLEPKTGQWHCLHNLRKEQK
jgi:hypothetical protein